jgi:hypothetical protein
MEANLQQTYWDLPYFQDMETERKRGHHSKGEAHAMSSSISNFQRRNTFVAYLSMKHLLQDQ